MFETVVYKWIKQLSPGIMAFDIGAHHGHYTKMLAEKFKFVVAFEPDPENFEVLKEQVSGLENVTPCPIALLNKSGPVKLYRGGNSTGHSVWDTGDGYIEVEAATLMTFDKLFPQFIKMDVEGAETLIWENSGNLLKRKELTVILETHHGADLIRLWNLFRHHEWTMLNYRDQPVSMFEPNNHYLLKKPSSQTVKATVSNAVI